MTIGSLLDPPSSGFGTAAVDLLAGAVDVLDIPEAVERLADGELILIRNDHVEAARFDLVALADRLTIAQAAFLIRFSSGFLQVAMRDSRCEQLQLPPVAPGPDRLAPQQCVSVDAAVGIGTGISATDRARTIALLGSSETTRTDLTRPGHVVPVRVAAHSRPQDTASLALGLAEQAGAVAVVFASIVGADPRAAAPTDAEACDLAVTHGIGVLASAGHTTRLHPVNPLPTPPAPINP